jgi:hypothetical protein
MSTLDRRVHDSVNRATVSGDRVASQAKRVMVALSDRSVRRQTQPFEAVPEPIDQEDSLVTSIENVIAHGKKEE